MTSRIFVSICGFCATAAACSSGDGGATATSSDESRALAETCGALAGRMVPPSSIALPTGGATVSKATVVAASGATPEYCKVEGAIRPVDPTAPPINFQLNLPSQWNGKAVHYGGAGLGGLLVTGVDNVPAASANAASPLARGYATFGSDSGHTGPTPADGSFALNAEARANFTGDQLKKTHDTAQVLIQARYGAGAQRMYFAGGSQGGHEALLVVQRWPSDYDGVVAHSPALSFTMVMIAGNRVAKALYAPGAFLNSNKVATLRSAVLRACDALDGVQDGIVSDTRSCETAFDVQNSRCPGGGEFGDWCLSDAQIAALNTMNTPFKLDFPLQAGLTDHPKWPIYQGAEIVFPFDFGMSPFPSRPPSPFNAGLHVLSDAVIRYFVTKDPNFDSLTFAPNAWRNQLIALSNQTDAQNPDISAFEARGGKLIIVHGTGDFAVNVGLTNAYYARLVSTFGQARADSFLRYYVIPGLGHGAGTFNATWDSISAIENWAERGQAPANLVATDANLTTQGRTRPMCRYPTWPRYTGPNPNAAASFTCVTQ
ncbi:tannase/feruloyl esterase family alpha/beta hydrolase [Pendulispora rubella]|uniref:Tannase/feruloyl esterase family alpha/beta hydrolase n=1 Tax=Pendulispora rubella TaxID=2741070 RepID=A0ABZ2L9Q9_9BACT